MLIVQNMNNNISNIYAKTRYNRKIKCNMYILDRKTKKIRRTLLHSSIAYSSSAVTEISCSDHLDIIHFNYLNFSSHYMLSFLITNLMIYFVDSFER